MSNNAIVSIYNTHTEAEEAVKTLQRAGLDMKTLSIVGKGYHSEERPIGFYTAGDRIKTWGGMGAFWGGLWGLLFGSAFFFLPGIGPILVAGPFAVALVGALEGAIAVGGLSALGAGLYSLGVSKDQIVKYESALKADKYLLVVHGTVEDTAKARSILDSTKAGLAPVEA